LIILKSLNITLNHFQDLFPVEEGWYTETEQQIDKEDYKDLKNKIKIMTRNIQP